MLRVGSGFDVHPLVSGRRLVLGGEVIDYPRGLQGHSDADVIVHALCDALLGALALGDIGKHFPPSDERFRDISSLVLLERVIEMVRAEGWEMVNADLTVICEEPKIAPFSDAMRGNIAGAVGAPVDTISIKATTTEKLGFTGRGDGIAALAVVLVNK
jgi:2-C-methyl-D-erythritol 2,4-cyclodiphosphate synthase